MNESSKGMVSTSFCFGVPPFYGPTCSFSALNVKNLKKMNSSVSAPFVLVLATIISMSCDKYLFILYFRFIIILMFIYLYYSSLTYYSMRRQ
jgi:hypothetical protein